MFRAHLAQIIAICMWLGAYLTSDLAPLQDHLGFRIDVGHVNASARDQDYRAYYTNDVRDHVARICADDIARFEYAF